MDLRSVFSRVSAQIAGRKQERTETYLALVLELANGKEPTTETITEVLESVGKSVEDLAGDVDLILKRREWKALLDQAPQFEAEQRRVAAERTAEEAKYQAALKELRGRYQVIMSDLRQREETVYRQKNLCAEAQVRLVETSGRNAEICALSNAAARPLLELQDGLLGREYRLAQVSVQSAKRKLAAAKANIDIPEGAVGIYVTTDQRERIANAEKELCRDEAGLKELQERVDALRADAGVMKERVQALEADALSVV